MIIVAYAATLIAFVGVDMVWLGLMVDRALFGFFAYATYDLTNQATLRGWTTQLSLIDMGWGFALSGFASLVGYFAAVRLA
jgi:uncharacterized membrane protein